MSIEPMTLPHRIEAAEGECQTCRWWRGRVSGRIYTPGHCIRYPPTVIVRDRYEDIQRVWPTMNAYDRCGEHALRAKEGA